MGHIMKSIKNKIHLLTSIVFGMALFCQLSCQSSSVTVEEDKVIDKKSTAVNDSRTIENTQTTADNILTSTGKKTGNDRQFLDSALVSNITDQKTMRLDLDNLETIKSIKENYNKRKLADTLEKDYLWSNSDQRLYTARPASPLYEHGRIKIKGKPGFTELPEKSDTLQELKDKTKLETDVSTDF
jgi:hypothetical protein